MRIVLVLSDDDRAAQAVASALDGGQAWEAVASAEAAVERIERGDVVAVVVSGAHIGKYRSDVDRVWSVALVDDESDAYTAWAEGYDQVVAVPRGWEGSFALRNALRGGHRRTSGVINLPESSTPPNMDSQLHQSARLALVGELSAAIAHEINNPLQYVTVSLEEARRHVSQELPGHRGANLRAYLDDALEGVDRIRVIASELLPFARSVPGQYGTTDFNALAMRALRMMRNELRHRAQLTYDFGKLRPVFADAPRLLQVVTNLILNAAQAIEEGHAQDNHVRLSTCEEDGFIVMRIEDTGCGISEAHLPHVFDRFYTTKMDHAGTGLGLSVSLDIVQAHGGTIEIESKQGRGTIATVKLPVGDLTVKSHSEPSPVAPASDERYRILAVDDDILVLKAYRRSLGRKHDMVFAGDGEDALAILEGDDAFDVIICDVMMPNMDGPRFYEALRAVRPELLPRVVFVSGGSFTARARSFVSSTQNRMLQKPIAVEDLEAVVAAVAREAAEIAT
ncbi:MAG: ATP-binding protein [Polyangiaceae bacterium]